jgi:hypothetical protein
MKKVQKETKFTSNNFGMEKNDADEKGAYKNRKRGKASFGFS